MAEPQNMPVLQLMYQRRIMDLHQLLITVVVGDCHEQIERLAGGKQRALRQPCHVHGRHRVIHQA